MRVSWCGTLLFLSAAAAHAIPLLDTPPSHPAEKSVDNHQVAAYLSTHYHEHLETLVSNVTEKVCSGFQNAVHIDSRQVSDPHQIRMLVETEVDPDIFRMQVVGGVDTYIKDEIPVILASSPLYSSPLANSIAQILTRYCPSPTNASCLKQHAPSIMDDLDVIINTHVSGILLSIRAAVPQMWKTVQQSVNRVVEQLQWDKTMQHRVTFSPLGEVVLPMGAERDELLSVKHDRGEVLRRFVQLIEQQL
ncbi:uncharacterized protein VTP21DRAFT_2703 [Calcarisporiella thermophila]|uniref:uncharacterized protein n=1 Tax=Calcarisporiella thermophila TaxID=911321 RepID=UPI0037441CA0